MADKHPKSLHKAKVAVYAVPKDASVDPETVGKIAKNLRRDIKRILQKNEDKPSDEQVGSAMGRVTERKEELAKEGKNIDISVGIVGERGEDGELEAYSKSTGDIAEIVADDDDFIEACEDEDEDLN